MNSATSASLSNTSSQQAFGNSTPNAGASTAPAFSSAGSTTSEDTFSKDAPDQQAPKEKKRTWPKVLATIAGILTVVGLGFLTRSGIRSHSIAEQIDKFKVHGEPKMQKILDEQFLVKEGSVEYKAKNDVEVVHPNNYTYMLKELLGMKSDARTQYLNDFKLNADEHKVQHQAITKWIEKNENTFKKAEASES